MRQGSAVFLASLLALAGTGPAAAQIDPGASLRGADVAEQLRQEAALRDMARKKELTESILAERQAASGRALSARLRGLLTADLMSLPLGRLEAFAEAGGLGDVEAAVREARGPKVVGDTAADLVFTPVTPCRIVNTTVAGGAIGANSSRNFVVKGTAGFAAQGGNAAGCGIPDEATSVEMNFVAVGPAGPGDLRAYPFGSATVPNASVINYSNVPGLNIANGIAQPVCNDATTTCNSDLTVQADIAASHLVVDVVGYYRRFDKAVVKSFVVTDRGVPGSANFSCVNAGGLSTTVTAPVSGTVVLDVSANHRFTHNTGISDTADFYFGTTATSCTDPAGSLSVLPGLPSGLYVDPVFVRGVYPLAAGSTATFFFNVIGQTSSGISASVMTATFIPD